MKKTKIICSIGPSSYDVETLCQMAIHGMNVARLINPDARHAHAARHHRHRHALVPASESQHVPHRRHLRHVSQKRLSNKLRSQRVARHQNRLGESTLRCRNMRCSHNE